MSKRLLSAALIAGLGIAFAPGAANAVDGTITFNGKIASNTCTINSGTPSFTVTLPTVGASALGTTGGTVAGTTPFNISLSACSATGAVKAYFEPGATINASGRLSTAVTGVDLRVLNDTQGPIDLNTQAGTTSATIASNAATLKYFVQYYNNGSGAGGAVSTGTVASTVAYSIVYQ